MLPRHEVPFAPLALHVPASHQLPAVHCASLLHGLVQPVPEQMYGAQSVPTLSTPHTPLPSQTWPLSRLPTQVLAPQEVPLLYSRHLPVPSHWPSFWHVVEESAEQLSWGSSPVAA